jgi:hypothetical protein
VLQKPGVGGYRSWSLLIRIEHDEHEPTGWSRIAQPRIATNSYKLVCSCRPAPLLKPFVDLWLKGASRHFRLCFLGIELLERFNHLRLGVPLGVVRAYVAVIVHQPLELRLQKIVSDAGRTPRLWFSGARETVPNSLHNCSPARCRTFYGVQNSPPKLPSRAHARLLQGGAQIERSQGAAITKLNAP